MESRSQCMENAADVVGLLDGGNGCVFHAKHYGARRVAYELGWEGGNGRVAFAALECHNLFESFHAFQDNRLCSVELHFQAAFEPKMPFKDGAPPGLIYGTQAYADWYVCTGGFSLQLRKKTTEMESPKIGAGGSTLISTFAISLSRHVPLTTRAASACMVGSSK